MADSSINLTINFNSISLNKDDMTSAKHTSANKRKGLPPLSSASTKGSLTRKPIHK